MIFEMGLSPLQSNVVLVSIGLVCLVASRFLTFRLAAAHGTVAGRGRKFLRRPL